MLDLLEESIADIKRQRHRSIDNQYKRKLKPRIKLIKVIGAGCKWCCGHGSATSVFGDSPKDAFDRWVFWHPSLAKNIFENK